MDSVSLLRTGGANRPAAAASPSRVRRPGRSVQRPMGTGGGRPADRNAATRSSGVAGGHEQLVVLAPAEGLLPGGTLGHRDSVEVDPDPGGLGQVAEVGQPGRRRGRWRPTGPGPAGRLALGQPGHRPAVGPDQVGRSRRRRCGLGRTPEPAGAPQEPQPGGRPAQRPGHEELVAGSGPRAEQRRPARPASAAPTTAVETTSTGDSARSPPTTTQAVSPAASASPAPRRSKSVPAGAATETRA